MSNDNERLNYQNAIVRPMEFKDVEIISRRYCFPWSSSRETQEKWVRYFKDQQGGTRTVGVLEMNGEILGYGSLLLRSDYPHFASIPEIHDVWIHQNHRRSGLAKRLIAWLEELARKKGFSEIGIGVGLYADYGPAQRLYFQLGYMPDGHGVTYRYQPACPGNSYPLDDDLVLWLKKIIRTNSGQKILGIDNVFFEVKDLNESVLFYEKLGFTVKLSIPKLPAVLFSVGSEEPGLIVCQKEQISPSKIWVEVANANEVKEACEKEGMVGKKIETATGFTFEVIDSSGNVIGFADYSKRSELRRKTSEIGL